ADGKNYNIEHYDLDMIISLGYRIKSSIATPFHIAGNTAWLNHALMCPNIGLP
ncbi:MAG: virulence RhuM family protein, partial [Deltaproteobacteria bacterium]|nr:virulence RhuM family protein [Deltaproteobacteria bacterium]